MPEQKKWHLRSGHYLGEISALCFLHLPTYLPSLPYLLAGSGSQILLYDLDVGNVIKSFHVFQGIRVHGISSSLIHSCSSSKLAYRIVVFGEKRVKIFNLHIVKESVVSIDLTLLYLLPKFSHWVLDVHFFKDGVTSSIQGDSCLAIGCSNNSICLWDIERSRINFQVQSSERCLLYSMKLWGDNLEALRIASGTIYNEILVWKLVPNCGSISETYPTGHQINLAGLFDCMQLHCQQHYVADHISKLAGHEGSVFRLAWSSDGSKLVSVSDDRSSRIWEINADKPIYDHREDINGPVLFGHNARIWDCCITDSLIVTAGEDCSCRVWGLDGELLKIIKEHIGRGIWRCLYDPNSSLLVTAGFDSAIKVHKLHTYGSGYLEGHADIKDFVDQTEVLTVRIPNSLEQIGCMDSKSEYVRCLHLQNEDNLYVATNHGYLYHAKLSRYSDVKWTELVRVSDNVPIVCMDLLSESPSEVSPAIVDWVAVGDGNGSMTIVRVLRDVCTVKMDLSFTWSAGIERQLLGTYWCKSLGHRHIFTADPRGVLKLWRLFDLPQSSRDNDKSCNVSLIAVFTSCFNTRIMCMDASFTEEVLICGDLRGNLILFPLLKDILLGTFPPGVEICPHKYFKGVHGITAVSSISIVGSSSDIIEIYSTGGDGCICYLEYHIDQKEFEFRGMRQVKGLSLIQSISYGSSTIDDFAMGNYAAGFASTDFIIWNLMTESKVVQIPCGGWRRPHSYYLGGVPEMKTCFAYLKEELIYIHRYQISGIESKAFPKNLHMQFHGRELHSLCFISEGFQHKTNGSSDLYSLSSWIATGCEDGTVRLTRFTHGVEDWTASKLLGEHVGGSAVRSLCLVSKTHIIESDVTDVAVSMKKQNAISKDREDPILLISVGAKRVLTSWLLRKEKLNEEETFVDSYEKKPLSIKSSSVSFQWLSTDMPTRFSSTHNRMRDIEKIIVKNHSDMKMDERPVSVLPEKVETEVKLFQGKKFEDDWRYLAVTAFLVKYASSRLTVCFVVVACSDASLLLRALVLPYRLWFDVALMVPTSSPVLALQHVVIPISLPFDENIQSGSAYFVISGATDGSISFWEVTESVGAFMAWVLGLPVENFIDCQKRPRTGRGSQGGRWWRSLSSGVNKKGPTDCSPVCSFQAMDTVSIGSEDSDHSPPEISEICPSQVLSNVHQSGINCLHVSGVKDCPNSDNASQYAVISGGDDQALHCLRFELSQRPMSYPENVSQDIFRSRTELSSTDQNKNHNHQHISKGRIRFLYCEQIASAHCSSIKGVWTDGTWVFSTGLDQRVRCWHLEENAKLTEHSHLVISVPEPEALDARAYGRNYYQIAVAGRGLQMVEFFATSDADRGEK